MQADYTHWSGDYEGMFAQRFQIVGSSPEPGLEGWSVYLDANNNGEHDDGEPETLTGDGGSYAFTARDFAIGRVGSIAGTIRRDVDDRGDFVVTWQAPSGSNVGQIFAELHDASGAVVRQDFMVSDGTMGYYVDLDADDLAEDLHRA